MRRQEVASVVYLSAGKQETNGKISNREDVREDEKW